MATSPVIFPDTIRSDLAQQLADTWHLLGRLDKEEIELRTERRRRTGGRRSWKRLGSPLSPHQRMRLSRSSCSSWTNCGATEWTALRRGKSVVGHLPGRERSERTGKFRALNFPDSAKLRAKLRKLSSV